MIYDVRTQSDQEIDKIVFAERSESSTTIAHRIERTLSRIGIYDGAGFVLVNDKEHAENLIKALRKAVDLGWIK